MFYRIPPLFMQSRGINPCALPVMPALIAPLAEAGWNMRQENGVLF